MPLITRTVTIRDSGGRVVASRPLPTGHRDSPAHFAGPVALWCNKWAAVHEHEGEPAIFALRHEVEALARGAL
jgi:hypothetical protein